MICYSPVSSAAFTRDVRLTGCVCVCVCVCVCAVTFLKKQSSLEQTLRAEDRSKLQRSISAPQAADSSRSN